MYVWQHMLVLLVFIYNTILLVYSQKIFNLHRSRHEYELIHKILLTFKCALHCGVVSLYFRLLEYSFSLFLFIYAHIDKNNLIILSISILCSYLNVNCWSLPLSAEHEAIIINNVGFMRMCKCVCVCVRLCVYIIELICAFEYALFHII